MGLEASQLLARHMAKNARKEGMPPQRRPLCQTARHQPASGLTPEALRGKIGKGLGGHASLDTPAPAPLDPRHRGLDALGTAGRIRQKAIQQRLLQGRLLVSASVPRR